jgi:hypothetical protein
VRYLRKKYTVDEIIDNKYAVLFQRDDETKKLDIPLTEIPIEVKEGDIIELEFDDDGKVVFAKVDTIETEKERENVGKLIKKLKDRSSKSLKGF